MHNAQSNRAVGVGLPFLVITAMPDTHLGHVNTDADKTDDRCYTLTTTRFLPAEIPEYFDEGTYSVV